MAQINVKVDDEVKARAEMVCRNIGMPLSTAINIYLVKLGNESRIPFEVSADPFYSEQNMQRLEKAAAAAKAGKHMTEHELIDDEIDDEVVVNA